MTENDGASTVVGYKNKEKRLIVLIMIGAYSPWNTEYPRKKRRSSLFLNYYIMNGFLVKNRQEPSFPIFHKFNILPYQQAISIEL